MSEVDEDCQQVPMLITVSAPETSVTDGLGSTNLIVCAGRRGGDAHRLVGSMVDAKAFDLTEVGQVPGSEREYAEEQHDIALATLQTGENDDLSGSDDTVMEDASLDADCIVIADGGGSGRSREKKQNAAAEAAEAAAAAAEAAAAKEFQQGCSEASPSSETPDTEEEDEGDDDDEAFRTIVAGTPLHYSGPPDRQQQQQLLQQESPQHINQEQEVEAEIDRAVQRSLLKSIRNTTVLSTHSKKQTMLGVSRPLNSLFTFDTEHSEQLDLELQDLLDFQL